MRALEAGAAGFVPKSAPPEELLMAIRSALSGKTFISPSLASDVYQSAKRDPELIQDPVTSLTPRRREILQLMAEGKTAKEIASLLDISNRTVESHKYEMIASDGRPQQRRARALRDETRHRRHLSQFPQFARRSEPDRS